MEAIWHRPDVHHLDVVGEEAIESLDHGRDRHAGRIVKVSLLSDGMHTGIRPSSGSDAWIGCLQQGQRSFHNLLYSQAVMLFLPAHIGAAIIAQGHQKAWHHTAPKMIRRHKKVRPSRLEAGLARA